MKLHVLIDDMRNFTCDIIFKNAETAQFVWYRIQADIECLYMDHDLGDGMTGYDFLKWLRDEYHGTGDTIYLPLEVVLVTSNSVGMDNMAKLLVNDLSYVQGNNNRSYIREEK